MLEKLLIIFCYFNFHLKTRLLDVKIGFGPSGKIEKVECVTCKKIYIRDNKDINLKIIPIVIILILLAILFF